MRPGSAPGRYRREGRFVNDARKVSHCDARKLTHPGRFLVLGDPVMSSPSPWGFRGSPEGDRGGPRAKRAPVPRALWVLGVHCIVRGEPLYRHGGSAGAWSGGPGRGTLVRSGPGSSILGQSGGPETSPIRGRRLRRPASALRDSRDRAAAGTLGPRPSAPAGLATHEVTPVPPVTASPQRSWSRRPRGGASCASCRRTPAWSARGRGGRGGPAKPWSASPSRTPGPTR